MKKQIFFVAIMLTAKVFMAQVAINTTGIPPVSSAMLDVTSKDKGVRFPHIALDSLKDMITINNPVDGLTIYNTTEPGMKGDLQKGYYYFDAITGTWVRLADNLNDNVWKKGGYFPGLFNIELRNKTSNVGIFDSTNIGSVVGTSSKVHILKTKDSLQIGPNHNIEVLTLYGLIQKKSNSFINRLKTSLIFTNNFQSSTYGSSSFGGVISSYLEGSDWMTARRGLNFYTFAPPFFWNIDTPSVSIFNRNVAIGAYAIDNGGWSEGRLQITGFSYDDNLSLRNPYVAANNWGMFVDAGDGNLFFYRNGGVEGYLQLPRWCIFKCFRQKDEKRHCSHATCFTFHPVS
jgi:hypothetical protein